MKLLLGYIGLIIAHHKETQKIPTKPKQQKQETTGKRNQETHTNKQTNKHKQNKTKKLKPNKGQEI